MNMKKIQVFNILLLQLIFNINWSCTESLPEVQIRVYFVKSLKNIKTFQMLLLPMLKR